MHAYSIQVLFEGVFRPDWTLRSGMSSFYPLGANVVLFFLLLVRNSIKSKKITQCV